MSILYHMRGTLYDSNHIEELVIRYGNGDDDSLGELISAFHPYLTKWSNVLHCNHINTMDKEVQEFISLFGAGNIFQIREILRSATSRLEDGEIESKLNEIFITKVAKYKPQGRNFIAYLRSTFKYSVLHWIRDLIKEKLLLYDSEYVDRRAVQPNQYRRLDYLDLEMAMECLTAKELRLIYMKYFDDMDTSQIGSVMSISPSAVSSILRTAEGKLRERLTHQS